MQKVLLDAVTTTTTSSPFILEGFCDITLQLLSANISAGNGVFTGEVSNDGIIWTAVNLLISNQTNTITNDMVRVASGTLSTNTNVVVALDEFFGFKMIRLICTVTTDGAYSAIVHANKI